jgi:hypothetical protein
MSVLFSGDFHANALGELSNITKKHRSHGTGRKHILILTKVLAHDTKRMMRIKRAYPKVCVIGQSVVEIPKEQTWPRERRITRIASFS